MGEVISLLSAAFFGLSSVYVQKGVLNDNTDFAVLYSVAVNALVYLVVFIIYINTQEVYFTMQGIIIFVLSGIFGAILGRKAMYKSIEYIGASRGTNINITSPFFALVLGYFILKEFPTSGAIPGMILTAGGIYYIRTEGYYRVEKDDTVEPKKLSQNSNRGFIFGLLSAIIFALAYVLRKAGLLHMPFPIIGASFGIFAAFICSIIYMYLSKNIKNIKALKKESKRYFIYCGIANSVAVLAQFYALQTTNTAIVMTLVSTQSLFAILFSVLFNKKGETITKPLLIGSVIVLAGVIIITIF